MSELKPCPFCGTSLEVKWFNFSPAGFGAECKSPCSFGVYGFDTKNECIKFVNTRPIEDELRAEIARLNEIIARLKEDGEFWHDAKDNFVNLESLLEWDKSHRALMKELE